MASINAASLFSVKGMVFVVTGGGSGIGSYMALALAANGASKVFILGRRQEPLDKIAQKAVCNRSTSFVIFEGHGANILKGTGNIIPVTCDVTSKESLLAAVAAVEKQTPFVNAVISNVGIIGTRRSPEANSPSSTLSTLQQDLWNTPRPEMSTVLETNIVGPYNTFLAFLFLLEAGNTHADSPGKAGLVQSQFICTTSAASIQRQPISPDAYSASKAGLTHLTKILSTRFARFGIRVNSFCAGFFSTEATRVSIFFGYCVALHVIVKLLMTLTLSGSIKEKTSAFLGKCRRSSSQPRGMATRQ